MSDLLTKYFTTCVLHIHTQEYLHHAESFPDARGELPKVTDPEIKYNAVGPTKIATVENQEVAKLIHITLPRAVQIVPSTYFAPQQRHNNNKKRTM